MPADDVNKRRAIINIFVHSIYLYDDNFTLIINASKKPLSIDNIPLDDIEAALSGDTYTSAKCSSMKLSAPPQQKNPNLVPAGAGFGFFYFSQRAYGFARCVFSLYIKGKKAPNGRRAVRSLVPSGKGGCGGV